MHSISISNCIAVTRDCMKITQVGFVDTAFLCEVEKFKEQFTQNENFRSLPTHSHVSGKSDSFLFHKTCLELHSKKKQLSVFP